VNDAGFGRLFNTPVDGYIYAQPLYVPNLAISGGTHNVVFAATEHDSVYAIDADTGAPLWPGGKRSFIDPANGITTMPSGETFSGDIVPEIGITGTPVIDVNTMYVVAKTKEIRTGDPNPHYVQKLYAIDITTGLNRATGGVVTLGDTTGDNNNTSSISVPGTGAGSVGGVVTFNARKENQRMSTQLVTNADSTKTVYLSYASHGDNGPYHGWVLGFNAATLAVQKVFNTAPNGSASGIWESGGNLGVDAQNNLYFATGNGFGTGFDANGGPRALGAGGGGLGYQNAGSAQGQIGITNSVSVRFRNFNPNNETGLGTNGNFGPGVSMPMYDFNRDSRTATPHVYQVTLHYDDIMHRLDETVIDMNDPARPTFNTSYSVDIPQTIGGNMAWVGFTGGTGGLNVQQDIQTWTYNPMTGPGINHSAGFASHSDLLANGSANFAGTVARVTTADNGQAGSIFSTSQVNVAGFTTIFKFQMTAGSNPIADGLTFTIQNKPAGTSYSESVLKLSTTVVGQSLPVVDFFTPNDWKPLDNADADLGSGGTILLPDAVGSAAHPHLIVETGKTGRMYLMDRDHLGENAPQGSADQILQTVSIGGAGVWGNPAFLQDGPNTGLIYYWGTGVQGKAFRITSGVVNPTPVNQTPFTIGFPGAQPSISSNGTNGSSAIMWALRTDNFGQQGPATLLAFNAENLGQQLWSSNDVIGRDTTGISVKFTMPIVTNGHVYAGTSGFLTGYGLLPAHAVVPAVPTSLQVTQIPPAQGGSTKLMVSWTNPDPNATLIKIERSTAGAGGPFTQIAQVAPTNQFIDMGLTPVTHYWYRVRATNQAGDSGYSNVSDNFTRLAASAVSVTNVTTLEVDLSWTATGNNGYRIERSTDNFVTFTVLATVPSNQTTYPDTTVVRPNTYEYRVHALNTNPTDESFSNVVTAVVGPLVFSYPFPDGITSSAGLQGNGSAQLLTGATQEHLIRLNNDFGQAGSVFTTNRVGVGGHWTNTFWIRLHEGTQPNPADGLTFTIQANSPTALGGAGGCLGYCGIGHSVAVKFDVYNNEGETDNSTGLFFNGDFPGLPHAPGEVNVPLNANVVNLRDQHRKRIDMSYDPATLTLGVTITDEQHDGGPTMVHQDYSVNIPAIIGTDAAYVGYTGGTGGLFSLQDVTGWLFPARAPGAPVNVQAATSGMSSITTMWRSSTLDEDNYVLERSRDNFHFTPVTTVDFHTTSYTDTGLAPGIYFYRVRATNNQGSSAPSASAQATVGGTVVQVDHSLGFADHNDLQANGNAAFANPAPAAGTIGIFTAHQDIGPSGDPTAGIGNATFANGTYTLTASGSDIWDTTDHMHYLYKSLNGDGEIIARVASENSTDYWTKGGLMIRNNLTPGSPNAFMLETADDHNEPVFQWRDNQDGGSGDTAGHPGGNVGRNPPIWLRLVRSGNTFSGFWAADINNGQSHGDWSPTPVNTPSGNTHVVPGIGVNTTVFVGLGLTAHNNGSTATATFDHVSITTVARLTDGGGGQASSIFKTARVPVTGGFTTSYIMNIRPVSGSADGTAFVLQADPRGAAALGDGGGGIGYFGGANGIRNSIAVKFDLYSQGSHHATTGLFLNGNFDQSRQIDMTSAGIDFGQNHSYRVDFSYDGSTLNEKITDLVSNRSFSTSYLIDLHMAIGADTAFVGFTGGTGGETAVQDIQNWTSTFNPFVVPPHIIATGLPASVRAGSVNTFTVTLRSADGSVAAGYRGTVHFTDPVDIPTPGDPNNAILPDDYTFTPADNGVHTFGAVFFKANPVSGPHSIIINDTANSRIIPDGIPNIVVTPARASSLFITSPLPSPTVAGAPASMTVTAFDRYGNPGAIYTGTVHFSSTDPRAGLPADYPFLPGDHGVHTFNNVSLGTVGSQSITVSDDANHFSDTQTGIAVKPRFGVTGFPSPTTAGAAGTFTVTAQNSDGSTATGYVGTVTFTSSDPQAELSDDYMFTPDDHGTHIFGAVMKTAGTQSITATDTELDASNGSQTGIVVVPSTVAGSFVVDQFPSPIVAGTPASFRVRVYDLYGNPAVGYTGTVALSSSDPQAVFPDNPYTFTIGASGDNGTHVFSGAILKTAGSQSIIVTDVDNGATGSQDNILVTASVAVRFLVSGYPSPTMAGDVNTFTVTAVDTYGNPNAMYNGTIHFSSSDQAANLPGDSPLGQGTFAAAFNTPGTQSLTATDLGDPSITGTQDGIQVVGPSSPTGGAFLVGGLAPASAAPTSTVSVAAATSPAMPVSASNAVTAPITPVRGNDQQFAVPGLKQDLAGQAATSADALGLALGDWSTAMYAPVTDDLVRARMA
jgi:hypothetical protein